MKLLVTGGTGFLGQHLVPKLLSLGHSVRILSRTAPGASSKGAEWIEGSLGDAAAVTRALEGVEAVYHLAGRVSFDPKDGREMYALHVDATRGLLGLAKKAGVARFILASTSGTIAASKEERILDETADYPLTVVGRWPYYLSKIYEEKLALEFCRRHELPLVVLNPSLLLGPGDARLSSTWTVSKFLNRDIPSMPNGGLSFVDVRDAAEVFAAALTRGELNGRHLFGVNMPFTEFFGRLERLTGVSAPRLRLPSKANVLGSQLLERWANLRGEAPRLEPHAAEIGEHFFYLDASKAQRLLGYAPRDPQQTLFDTVQDLMGRMPPGSWPGVKGRLFEARRPGRAM